LILDREGNPLPEQMEALSEIGHITQKKIEELRFSHIIKPDAPPAKKEETPLVESMLSGCRVINYLVDKAKETHYLNNSERVTLLYTLGILGEDGKDFLHYFGLSFSIRIYSMKFNTYPPKNNKHPRTIPSSLLNSLKSSFLSTIRVESFNKRSIDPK